MRIRGKWLTAGGLAVALAAVLPAMATASGPSAAARWSVAPVDLASLSTQQLAGGVRPG